MQTSPPFDEALETFRGFLRSQDVSGSLRWIWRDAVISRRGSGSYRSANRPLYLDASRLATETEILDYYNVGVARNLGIALSVFCIAESLPYCYVELPEDETDAEYKMMGSLKCSIPNPTPMATLIRSPFVASVMRFFIRIPSTAWIRKTCRSGRSPARRGVQHSICRKGPAGTPSSFIQRALA